MLYVPVNPVVQKLRLFLIVALACIVDTTVRAGRIRTTPITIIIGTAGIKGAICTESAIGTSAPSALYLQSLTIRGTEGIRASGNTGIIGSERANRYNRSYRRNPRNPCNPHNPYNSQEPRNPCSQDHRCNRYRESAVPAVPIVTIVRGWGERPAE